MKPIILGCAMLLGVSAATLQAGPEQVQLPDQYRTTMTPYFFGDRTANNKQVIRVYANQTALDGKRADGKLPYGSVLVGELYKVKLDASGQPLTSRMGQRIAGQMAAIVVMQRGEGFDREYPDALKVGDWEFAVFSPAGERLDKDVTACRTCHHPLTDSEFVFSYEHL